MRVAVTGGTGLIGSHLVEVLLAEGHEVRVLARRPWPWGPPPAARWVAGSLADPLALAAVLQGAEVVCHLAWTGIHEQSNADPAADLAANLAPGLALLDACRAAGVRRLVFASSGGTVYGPADALPIPETHPTRPRSVYGIHKLTMEHYLRLAWQLHGLEPVLLRPSVAYGPRQSPHRRQGAVAVFLYRVSRGEPLTLWGDGSGTRDYCFVTDLAAAFALAVASPGAAGGVFNLGGPEPLSLAALLARVEAVVGRTARVERAPARAFDAPSIVLDTGAARAVLGWRPAVGLDEGLARTWAWLRDQP